MKEPNAAPAIPEAAPLDEIARLLGTSLQAMSREKLRRLARQIGVKPVGDLWPVAPLVRAAFADRERAAIERGFRRTRGRPRL